MDQQKSCSLKWAPKKARQRRAHVFSLIYFFAKFSIFHIPHNYVIPQAVPHAIPQTHSSFYPHRCVQANSFLVRILVTSCENAYTNFALNAYWVLRSSGVFYIAFLAKQVFTEDYWSGNATETDTKETVKHELLWNDAKQAKRLYRSEDNWESLF